MELLKTYIGYIVGILGFAGMVWTYATKNAESKYDVIGLEKDVVEMNTRIIPRSEMVIIIDSIISAKLSPIVGNQITLAENYNSLRGSYVSLVKDLYLNKPLTFNELEKYMNGVEWQLIIPKVDSSNFKIKITKANSNGQK